ncbi:MAG: TraB/GumN family protein [Myxococcaceae bacterium]|nr:TraB/GumN family protein [Myxococcaceae bacterium]
MRLNRLLVALLLTSTFGCATASKEAASTAVQPAALAEKRAFLWEVTRPEAPDRPLYLTGSVHVGQPGRFVFPPSLEAAFARANALVVELDPDAVEPRQMQEVTLRLGLIAPPDSLTAHLTEETRKLLPAALQKVGLTPAAVERLRPWMLSATLAVLELQKAGFSQEAGIDRLLLERARGKKAIVPLETAEEQLSALSGLPDAVQDLMLRDQLQQSGMMEVAFAQMVTAWEGGNPDALAAVVYQNMEDPTFKPLYESLFFDRNRKMADKLEALLAKPETHFAVVGAGHLVGEQGIPALLEKRGLKVRQLPREN